MKQTIIEKLLSDIDKVTAEFTKYFGNLSIHQLNYKKESSQWSIAQNINHIIMVNDSYLPVIESIREKRYRAAWHARLGFLVKYFGRKLLDMVQPHNNDKVRTLPLWEPRDKTLDDVVPGFIMHQQTLKQLIMSSKDLVDAGTVICSPASRLVVHKLEDAFKIMVVHEQRHLEQAKHMLAMQYSQRFGF